MRTILALCWIVVAFATLALTSWHLYTVEGFSVGRLLAVAACIVLSIVMFDRLRGMS